MKRSLTISGVAVLVLALAAPAAFARGPRGGFGPGGAERGARMAERLGLDTQQTETMKKLRELHQSEMQAAHDQLRAKREALEALWQGDTVDRGAILAATKQISALQAQLDVKRVDHLFAIKSVLTAEQFKQFMVMGPGHRGHRGHRGMSGHHGKRGQRGMRGRGGMRGQGAMGGDCPFAPGADEPDDGDPSQEL